MYTSPLATSANAARPKPGHLQRRPEARAPSRDEPFVRQSTAYAQVARALPPLGRASEGIDRADELGVEPDPGAEREPPPVPFLARSAVSARARFFCAQSRSDITGHAGSPSARGSTLEPPPGTKPNGGVSLSAPFTASLKTAVAGEDVDRVNGRPHASRAISVACPGRSRGLGADDLHGEHERARATASDPPGSVTALAYGFATMRTARAIARPA